MTHPDTLQIPRAVVEQAKYDMSIHNNPDAQAWAKFFIKTQAETGFTIDEGLMISWFANAMMAMHDYLKQSKASTLEEIRAALQAQPTPPVGQAAAGPHVFNDESPFCVKCGSTGEDATQPVAHILPRNLKILKFKSMSVPVDPLPYDNGEEKTVPLYTTPQPTPDAEAMSRLTTDRDEWKEAAQAAVRLLHSQHEDTAEAIRLALEALKFIKEWGECALAVEKRDAAIAALEKVKGPKP